MATKVNTDMLKSLASASPASTDASNSGKVVQLNSTGVIPAAYYSSGGGSTALVDQWRMTADLTDTADPISANLTRVLLVGSTGMTVASGVWTFPETGIYKVEGSICADLGAGAGAATATMHLTTNATSGEGPSWAEIALGAEAGNWQVEYGVINICCLIDVTAVADVKVKFVITQTNTAGLIMGHATSNRTIFTFERLGDT